MYVLFRRLSSILLRVVLLVVFSELVVHVRTLWQQSEEKSALIKQQEYGNDMRTPKQRKKQQDRDTVPPLPPVNTSASGSGSRGQAANNVAALEAQLTHQVTLIEQQRNKIMELETQARWYSTTLQRIAGEKEWAALMDELTTMSTKANVSKIWRTSLSEHKTAMAQQKAEEPQGEPAVGTVKTSPAATARSSVQKTAKEKTAREIRRAFCTRTKAWLVCERELHTLQSVCTYSGEAQRNSKAQ